MRVTLVCADPLLCEGLASLLKYSGGIEVVLRDATLARSIDRLDGRNFDALVMTADALDGVTPKQIEALVGKAGAKVVYIGSDPPAFPISALVDPKMGSIELFAALRNLNGRVEGQTTKAETDSAAIATLSPEDRELAKLLARGLGNRAIAELTRRHESDVRSSVSRIMATLGCGTRLQLIMKLDKQLELV